MGRIGNLLYLKTLFTYKVCRIPKQGIIYHKSHTINPSSLVSCFTQGHGRVELPLQLQQWNTTSVETARLYQMFMSAQLITICMQWKISYIGISMLIPEQLLRRVSKMAFVKLAILVQIVCKVGLRSHYVEFQKCSIVS